MASSGSCDLERPGGLPEEVRSIHHLLQPLRPLAAGGVWSRIIDALAAAHDAAVQMIDTSIVRVHQHGACITRNQRQSMGRSRGGLTSKIHAVVDGNGLPVRLALSPGEAHDVRLAGKLLSRLKSGSMLLADRGYDADWIRELAMKNGAWARSRRKATAAIRSALARTSTALATGSNGSSTGSSNAVGWRRATTGSRQTTLPSSNCIYPAMAGRR